MGGFADHSTGQFATYSMLAKRLGYAGGQAARVVERPTYRNPFRSLSHLSPRYPRDPVMSVVILGRQP